MATPRASHAAAKAAALGSMCGSGDARSLTRSTSKYRAPGRRRARNSATASRFIAGRYQEQSRTLTRARFARSQSAETIVRWGPPGSERAGVDDADAIAARGAGRRDAREGGTKERTPARWTRPRACIEASRGGARASVGSDEPGGASGRQSSPKRPRATRVAPSSRQSDSSQKSPVAATLEKARRATAARATMSALDEYDLAIYPGFYRRPMARWNEDGSCAPMARAQTRGGTQPLLKQSEIDGAQAHRARGARPPTRRHPLPRERERTREARARDRRADPPPASRARPVLPRRLDRALRAPATRVGFDR